MDDRATRRRRPARPNVRLDLIPGEPDAARFPRAAWLRCTARCWRPLPTICSATATPLGWGSCEQRSLATSTEPATQWRRPTRRPWFPAPPAALIRWRGCSTDKVPPPSPSRSPAPLPPRDPAARRPPSRAGAGQRRGHRCRRTRSHDRQRRRRHTRPPVSPRHRHESRAPHEARQLGPGSATHGSSRTTTTASSATTVARSARSRASRPIERLSRHHQQDTGSQPAHRLDRATARTSRLDGRAARP